MDRDECKNFDRDIGTASTHSLHGLERCKLEHPPEDITGKGKLVVWLLRLARVEAKSIFLDNGFQGIRVEFVLFVVYTGPRDFGIGVVATA